MRYFMWAIGAVFYTALGFYCFDSSNSDGNRAVAAMVICLFYIRHEAHKQEQRHAQLLDLVKTEK